MPNTKQQNQPHTDLENPLERRQTFRVEEFAVVEYQLLDEPQSADLAQCFDQAERFQHYSKVQALDLEFQSLLNSRNDLDATSLDLFKLLNQKIQATAAMLSIDNEQSQQSITLSEAGLSFTTEESLIPGQTIALRFRLIADGTGLLAKATVVYQLPLTHPSEETEHNRFRTGCQFIELDEASQQLLNRHLLAYQGQFKREQVR